MSKPQVLDADETRRILRSLVRLAESDPEAAHVAADDTLCAFLRWIGHRNIAKLWEKIGPKWYA